MELLEQHFDKAFAAPDGILRLRELILKLAMQGKLVPQDPSAPPARELLRSIEAEKKRLVKERKIKAPKPLPEITASEEPYALPQGWQWVRLGAVGNVFNGNSINASEKESKYAGTAGLPYIATKDVGYGFSPLNYDNGICIPPNEEKFKIAHHDAVLICAEGGSAGKKCGLTDRDICFGNKLFANELYGQIPSRFILYVYLSPTFRASFAAAMTGIIGGVSIAKFVEIPIPLPPHEEQRRIVTKIDELMARCNELEKLRTDQEEKRLMVHAAATQKLLNVAEPEQHKHAQAFFADHFGELYTVKENVAELRKTILQLAVMGRLVPQNPNGPPASELLKEIEAEKKRLVKAGEIKAPKPLPPVAEEEKPYELPQGWEWVRLGDLGITQTGTTPPSKDRESYGDYIPFIGPGNIKNGCINYSGDGLSEEGLLKARLINANSVLMVCIGGSIGKHAINDRNTTCNQQINTLTPYHPIPVQYIYRAMATAYFQMAVLDQAGGSATPIINKQKWANIPVPIPPLHVQHCIVNKIDELMALSDSIDRQIDAATTKKTELLDAVMALI